MEKNTVLILFASVSLTQFTVTSLDAEVSCVHLESCLLPCVFEPGPDPIINWIKNTAEGDVPVHSISKGQLQSQDEHYKQRTSLSAEEINAGNASLLLTEVKVQDEGRYVCLTSSGHDIQTSFINLKVYVDIDEVDVVPQGLELVCSSKGLYPEPAVTWLTGDPLTEVEGSTTVRQREDQLFDVSSSVQLRSDVNIYSCNVSTAKSWRRTAFILTGDVLVISDSDAVLRSSLLALPPCAVPKAPIKSLLWKFNHQYIIYNWTGSQRVFNESWRPHVYGVTESFDLVLRKLSTDQHAGQFSCHIHTDTETFIIVWPLNIRLMHPMFTFLLISLLLHLMNPPWNAAQQPQPGIYLLTSKDDSEKAVLPPADVSGENAAADTHGPLHPEEIPLTQEHQEVQEESAADTHGPLHPEEIPLTQEHQEVQEESAADTHEPLHPEEIPLRQKHQNVQEESAADTHGPLHPEEIPLTQKHQDVQEESVTVTI